MRSYQLEQRVPGLLERLAEQSEIIKGMAAELQEITGERGGHTATLLDLARMLDRMVDRPDRIPNMLREYRDGIGNLGTWIMDDAQPAAPDRLFDRRIRPACGFPGPSPPSGRLWSHEVRAFITSFFHDYTGILEIVDESQVSPQARRRPARRPRIDAIKVWIGHRAATRRRSSSR